MERFLKPDTYAVWSKDTSTRYNSTSGGAFSELANVILDEGGLIVGAKYNQDNLVEHCVATDKTGIEELRQSKYLSSSMGDSYRRVREELIKGKKVAFCGSPCQVAGLYTFLGKEYDNLLCIDFICRGMNSPKAYKSWLKEVEMQSGSKVKKVWFKYKKGGWKSSPQRTRVDFENGKYKVFENEKNLYMYGYLSSNLYLRPCCGNCKFKGLPRKSDITLADYWGIEKELDDDKGTSMVLVNSEKGRLYFKKAKKNLEFYKKDFDSILDNNPMFTYSVVINDKRKEFLVDLDKMNFSDALKKYGVYPPKISLSKRIKRYIKKLIRVCRG